MSDVRIRLATADDLNSINEIYNYYVLHSTCTYQVESSTAQERLAWFAEHGPKHAITVAEVDNHVIGWGSVSRFHSRCAYSRTVEDSVYVRHDGHRKGIGTAILTDLIERSRAAGHHTIVALIDSSQPGSLALHRKLGFEPRGHLREVGNKFDRWLDVIYMQLLL
ncbi:MAG TPA: GNAT family N-acetyltransferase [Tepidisphaeraceae bacterium]|nr:GNAT family N-acetyltransferase [Tepidisphaeraceae bacterium]